MANDCEYLMRIIGDKRNVKELACRLNRSSETKKPIGRVWDFTTLETYELDDGRSAIEGYGGCAWSVLCAMRKPYIKPEYCIESAVEALNLLVEIWSSEPGCQFQEHCIIDRGAVLVDDCKDWGEVETEDGEFKQWGGFENYGEFNLGYFGESVGQLEAISEGNNIVKKEG